MKVVLLMYHSSKNRLVFNGWTGKRARWEQIFVGTSQPEPYNKDCPESLILCNRVWPSYKPTSWSTPRRALDVQTTCVCVCVCISAQWWNPPRHSRDRECQSKYLRRTFLNLLLQQRTQSAAWGQEGGGGGGRGGSSGQALGNLAVGVSCLWILSPSQNKVQPWVTWCI